MSASAGVDTAKANKEEGNERKQPHVHDIGGGEEGNERKRPHMHDIGGGVGGGGVGGGGGSRRDSDRCPSRSRSRSPRSRRDRHRRSRSPRGKETLSLRRRKKRNAWTVDCEFCRRAFANAADRSKHYEDRLRQRCKVCLLPLCQREMSWHLNQNHYRCPTCDPHWFVDQKAHDSARKLCGSKNAHSIATQHHKCNECQKWSITAVAHETEKKKCPFCEAKTCRLVTHFKNRHHFCEQCKKGYPDQKSHPEIKKCPFCEANTCKLVTHIKNRHHFCEQCQKGYPDQKSHPETQTCQRCSMVVCDMALHLRDFVRCRAEKLISGSGSANHVGRYAQTFFAKGITLADRRA